MKADNLANSSGCSINRTLRRHRVTGTVGPRGHRYAIADRCGSKRISGIRPADAVSLRSRKFGAVDNREYRSNLLLCEWLPPKS